MGEVFGGAFGWIIREKSMADAQLVQQSQERGGCIKDGFVQVDCSVHVQSHVPDLAEAVADF